jgi:hypothetical protein
MCAPPDILDPDDDLTKALSEDLDWSEAAPVARKALLGIARGGVKASQGQIQALKEIIARAEGRVGTIASDDERPIGIVVLPMLRNEEGIPWMGADPDDEPEKFYNGGLSAWRSDG